VCLSETVSPSLEGDPILAYNILRAMNLVGAGKLRTSLA
jgi:hypothetical protein